MKWMVDIPEATVRTIRSSSGDDFQRRRRCWEVYLNDHPAPSWKQVAYILFCPNIGEEEIDYLEELEMVQKKYLRGESAVVTCVIIALLLVSMNKSTISACYVCLEH